MAGTRRREVQREVEHDPGNDGRAPAYSGAFHQVVRSPLSAPNGHPAASSCSGANPLLGTRTLSAPIAASGPISPAAARSGPVVHASRRQGSGVPLTKRTPRTLPPAAPGSRSNAKTAHLEHPLHASLSPALNRRSGAHTFAGFPSGNLFELPRMACSDDFDGAERAAPGRRLSSGGSAA